MIFYSFQAAIIQNIFEAFIRKVIQIVLKYIKFEKSLNLHDFLLILSIFEDFRYEFFSMSGKNDVHKFSFSITKRDRVSIYFKLEKLKNQEKKNEYLFIYFTFQVARSKSKTFIHLFSSLAVSKKKNPQTFPPIYRRSKLN